MSYSVSELINHAVLTPEMLSFLRLLERARVPVVTIADDLGQENFSPIFPWFSYSRVFDPRLIESFPACIVEVKRTRDNSLRVLYITEAVGNLSNLSNVRLQTLYLYSLGNQPHHEKVYSPSGDLLRSLRNAGISPSEYESFFDLKQ